VGGPILSAAAQGLAYGASRQLLKDKALLSKAPGLAATEVALDSAIMGLGAAAIHAFRLKGPQFYQELKKIFTKPQTFEYEGAGKVLEYDSIKDAPEWLKSIYRVTPAGECAVSKFDSLNELGAKIFRSKVGVSREGPPAESILEFWKGDQLKFWNSISVTATKTVKETGIKVPELWDKVREELLSGECVSEISRKLRDRHIALAKRLQKRGLLEREIDVEKPMQQGFRDDAGNWVSSHYLTESGLPEDVFYFPRVWRKDKCISRRDELLELLTEGQRNLEYNLYGTADMERTLQAARGQYARILGTAPEDRYTVEGVMGIGGLNKERTVLISDQLLTPYLETNPAVVFQQYERKVLPVLAEKEVLGSVGWDEYLSRLDMEYMRLATAPGKGTKYLFKLDEEYRKARRVMLSLPKLMEGTFDAEAASSSPTLAMWITSLKAYGVAKDLGMLLFSSLENPVNIFNAHGFSGLLKGFGAELKQAFRNTESKKELAHLGAAVQVESYRFMKNMDRLGVEQVWENASPLSQAAAKYSRKAAQATMKWSLSNCWEDFWARVSGRLVMEKLVDLSSKLKLARSDLEFMHSNGISPGLLRAVGEQYARYGYKESGLSVMNLELWSDREVAEKVGAMIAGHTHNVIIQPGLGDVPLALRTLGGKALTSYLTYGFGYTNNIVMDWVRKGQIYKPIATAFMGFALNSFGEYMKALSSGDRDRFDAKEYFARGVLRTSALTWVSDCVSSLYQIVHGAVKRDPLQVQTGVTRRLGTPASVFMDVSTMLGALSSDRPMSEYQARRFKSYVFFMGLPILSGVGNEAIRHRTRRIGGRLLKRTP
jgi:hypothetical protein